MTDNKKPAPAAPSTEVARGGIFTAEGIAAARRETDRLGRELDITNADHVALWLEANLGDSSLGWLAVRIVEAHEATLSPASDVPPIASSGEVEFLRDLAGRLFKFATPAMGFDQGDTDQLYAIARRLATPPAASSGQDLREAVIERLLHDVQAEWSYREDDIYPPRDFWHVRMEALDLSTDWMKVGEQEQKALSPQEKQAGEYSARECLRGMLRHAQNALAPAVQPGGDLVAALDWFSGQHNLELFRKQPVYGDDDDQTDEWQVTRVNGGINDRECTVIGRGETAAQAILAAATPQPEAEEGA